ncbi:unnamed protein product [Parnassius mnemosyne]|uniref:Retrotransposon gag domain-containing protein n=1 Tax=Parnassius mnemosyne TaxID=213953 RepID=A0AAV1MAC0_9NEOP
MPKDEPITMSKETKVIDMNFLSKFINKFDGNREKLNAFLNNCRNAISLASPSQQDIILKYILSQLEGRAESACSIKEFENWQQLEEFLKNQFGEKKHYAALLSDLQDCCQTNSETVNQFALRVETCLSKLLTEINISIPTKKKGELTGRVAAMQDLALHTFVSGLNPRLSTVVRCRDPETLNEAIGFAVSEEKILQTSSKRNPSANNTSSPNQRRWPQRQSQPSRNPIQRGYSNNTNSQGPSTSGLPVCRYCKNVGHTIENCRKREFNNNRFRDQNNQRRYQNNQAQIHAVNINESSDTEGQGESNDDLNA